MKIYAPNATLVARREWCDGLATFTVKPDDFDLPEFEAGQFTNLALPEGDDWDPDEGKSIKRAYSIASAPGLDSMDFFVRRVDDGALTPKMFALEVGDRIWLDQRIAGHFTLESAMDAEDLVLVGTGTGVAPYRPMIQQKDLRSRFGRTILLYSDRHVHDLGYVEEFTELAANDDSFVFLPTITGNEPEEKWSGLRGRVQTHLVPEAYEALTGKPLTPERCQVFLCGNPKMILDVQENLGAFGFQKHKKREPGQLHMEKYW